MCIKKKGHVRFLVLLVVTQCQYTWYGRFVCCVRVGWLRDRNSVCVCVCVVELEAYPSLSREPSPSDSTEGALDMFPRRGLGDVFLLLELDEPPLLLEELPPPFPPPLLLLLRSVPLISPDSPSPKPSVLLKLLLCLTRWRRVLGITSSDRWTLKAFLSFRPNPILRFRPDGPSEWAHRCCTLDIHNHNFGYHQIFISYSNFHFGITSQILKLGFRRIFQKKNPPQICSSRCSVRFISSNIYLILNKI